MRRFMLLLIVALFLGMTCFATTVNQFETGQLIMVSMDNGTMMNANAEMLNTIKDIGNITTRTAYTGSEAAQFSEYAVENNCNINIYSKTITGRTLLRLPSTFMGDRYGMLNMGTNTYNRWGGVTYCPKFPLFEG
jgi:hypothetical protein